MIHGAQLFGSETSISQNARNAVQRTFYLQSVTCLNNKSLISSTSFVILILLGAEYLKIYTITQTST